MPSRPGHYLPGNGSPTPCQRPSSGKRRINATLQMRKQVEYLWVGKRQNLRQDDTADAPHRINPEVCVAQPDPGQTAGAVAVGRRFGIDQKT